MKTAVDNCNEKAPMVAPIEAENTPPTKMRIKQMDNKPERPETQLEEQRRIAIEDIRVIAEENLTKIMAQADLILGIFESERCVDMLPSIAVAVAGMRDMALQTIDTVGAEVSACEIEFDVTRGINKYMLGAHNALYNERHGNRSLS